MVGVSTSNRTRAGCPPFRPSSSSSSLRAPPVSSQRALLCSHLERRPLDEVRTASPSHGAWKQVDPLQWPLLASAGCGWRSGRQSPEGNLCLEMVGEIDLVRLRFQGIQDLELIKKDSNARQIQLTIFLALSLALGGWSSQLTSCSSFLSVVSRMIDFQCE